MDSRPRNNNGQFAPDEMSGMDPNTTSAAYNPQIIEARKATLAEKLRRAIGLRRGVEESVPQEQRVLSRFDHRGHREHRVELARGDYAIPALRKILDTKRKSQPTHFWPSTLEGMQPDYRNRYSLPPDGTFVPSLKFSGKDTLWSRRKVPEKNSAGFVTKLQPGVSEGSDFRVRSGLSQGEHANNRRWAADFIRQARKERILSAKLRLRELARQAAYDPYAVQEQPA
jgi:hypothetical protein